jgi:hypothetical protein
MNERSATPEADGRAGDATTAAVEEAIGRYAAAQAEAGARLSEAEAVRDVAATEAASGTGPEAVELAESLRAILAGASPDDAALLRKILRGAIKPDTSPEGVGGIPPDEELSKDWRHGGYPYKHRMSRNYF